MMSACAEKGITIDEEIMRTTNGVTPTAPYSQYDNADFSEVDCGGESQKLKGQFPTGIADPFVMRYNGVYYLYCTTSGANQYGVRGWKSEDLINWELCTGEGLPEGYVVSQTDEAAEGEAGRYTQNAYAPEVYRFNGKFYMYISPGSAASSRGHYVLVSDSPEGPFEYHGGKLDTKIDGSVFIDDDEKTYFLHATHGAITMRNMENMKDLGDSATVPSTNLMGGWTEGPMLVKIRGKYYLTYTGLHYQTAGYQVCYSVADELEGSSMQNAAASFRTGAQNPILLNCDKEEGHVGLGHSCTVLGPDLDSYYIVYHNLDELYSDGMTHRSLNFDRLLVSDSLMTCAPCKTGSIAPKNPAFFCRSQEGLNKEGEFALASKEHASRFTAEYNFCGEAQFVFSYRNAQNYNFVAIDYSAKKIYLNKCVNSRVETVKEGTLVNEFSAQDLHTVRVEYDGGLCRVYFDDMCKITAENMNFEAGKMGYRTQNTNGIGYTALSMHANGSSDRAEIKQANGAIPAATYLEDAEGAGAYLFTGKSGLEKTEGTGAFAGLNQIYLQQKYDYARYLISVLKSGNYGLEILVRSRDCGKTICMEIDGGEYKLLKIPEVSTQEDYVKVLLPKTEISAGVHQFKIQNVGQEFAFVSFSLRPIDGESYSASLTQEALPQGATAQTEGYAATGEGLSAAGERAFIRFGNRYFADFELKAEMAIASSASVMDTQPFGFILREDNFADANVPNIKFSDAYCHVQGYFLSVTKYAVTLSKLNFGNVKSYDLVSKKIATEGGKFYSYKIRMAANTLQVFRSGELLLEYTDAVAFTSGAVGFYSYGGATGTYRNLTITAL